MHPQQASSALLASLLALHPKKIDLSLGRIERLMAKLGRPDKTLPPVFHIAGTNGKGSVAAFLHALLLAAGKKAHLYTSPHLTDFHERIKLAHRTGARNIGEDRLADLLQHAASVNDGEPITYFEITTATALLAFAQAPADAVILETGLGGRLDATNIITRPEAVLLTPVALDHHDFLGATRRKIAYEKAGIIKKNRPVFSARQSRPAAEVIAARAAALTAPLFRAGHHWRLRRTADGFFYRQKTDGQKTDGQETDKAAASWHLPPPALAGAHQYDNAALALACLRQTGWRISEQQAARALAAAVWPGRLQNISSGEAARRARPHRLWVDGGHNPHAARALAQSFAASSSGQNRPLYLICAMRKNKDCAGFFRAFRRQAAYVWTLDALDDANPDAVSAMHSAASLAAAARREQLSAKAAASLEDALAQARRKRAGDLLVCGTLALAAALTAR